eukprot:SAG22_NODE_4849_length_1151_cov_1.119772_1_plen_52_part_00
MAFAYLRLVMEGIDLRPGQSAQGPSFEAEEEITVSLGVGGRDNLIDLVDVK